MRPTEYIIIIIYKKVNAMSETKEAHRTSSSLVSIKLIRWAPFDGLVIPLASEFDHALRAHVEQRTLTCLNPVDLLLCSLELMQVFRCIDLLSRNAEPHRFHDVGNVCDCFAAVEHLSELVFAHLRVVDHSSLSIDVYYVV